MFLNERQLKCKNGHSYDLSSEGYINLVRHAVKTNYSRQMFKSRKNITQKGFFKPLVDRLGPEIIKRKNDCKSLTILDAGCGEGTLFHQLKEKLSANFVKINSAGTDISKEGIKLASRDYPDTLWMVSNLADLPVVDNSADVIINLLAPANYSQFRRILAPGGILLKVIPGKEYLKELRELFAVSSHNCDNMPPPTLSLFEKHFQGFESTHIQRKIHIDEETLPDLLEMTPLLWNISDKKIKLHEVREVTIDLYLLSGCVEGK